MFRRASSQLVSKVIQTPTLKLPQPSSTKYALTRSFSTIPQPQCARSTRTARINAPLASRPKKPKASIVSTLTKRRNATQQPQPTPSNPVPEPIPPSGSAAATEKESLELLYSRRRHEEHLADLKIRMLDYGHKMEQENAEKALAKTSPLTSFSFFTVAILLPVLSLGWMKYKNPTQLQLWTVGAKRFFHLWKNPQYRQLYLYFAGVGPLSTAERVLASECNLQPRVDIDGNPCETPEELDARMTQNVISAQHIFYHELGKAYLYIGWLNGFGNDLENLMAIPGFKNDHQAEMQTRQMKMNCSEAQQIINHLIGTLTSRVSRLEYRYQVDPQNLVEEYKPKFKLLLEEQERLKMVDELKLGAYKMTNQAKQDNKAHTGIKITPKVQKDGKSVLLKGEEFTNRGEDSTVIHRPFDPTTATAPMTLPTPTTPEEEEIYQIEMKKLAAVHRGEQDLARLKKNELEREVKIAHMESQDYVSPRVIPSQLEVKPIEKYNSYEMKLAYLLDLQTTTILVQSMTNVLEMAVMFLANEAVIIQGKKRLYAQQEEEKEQARAKQTQAVKQGNFFTDNSLGKPNPLTGSSEVSRYDFTIDIPEFLRITDKQMFLDVHKVVTQGLLEFWDDNSFYNYDQESLNKALDMFPQSTSSLETATGLNALEIRNLPKKDNMVARFASFPSRVNQTTFMIGSPDLPNFFDKITRDKIKFLGQFSDTTLQPRPKPPSQRPYLQLQTQAVDV